MQFILPELQKEKVDLIKEEIYWTGICKQTTFKMFSFSVLSIVAFMPGLSSGGSHSLRYFYTGVSGTSEFPEFNIAGYVNDAVIGYYDSVVKRYVPRAQWMKENEGQDYWDRQTQISEVAQQMFKANVRTVMDRNNQTSGIHSFQFMCGCYLHDDDTKSGFWQYGYDGQDFITFHKETQTWTAVAPSAVITKNKWDHETAGNTYQKGYLEQECIEWLQKYIKYGQSSLGKKVPPEAKVTWDHDNTKMKCTVSGFYPQDIDVYFVKNDRDKIETAISTGVLPNSDGTYYIEKLIEIDPQDKEQHACHVEHESLKPKLIKKIDPESSSNVALIVGIVAAAVVLIAAIVGVVIYKRKQEGDRRYAPANKSDKTESSSNSSENA